MGELILALANIALAIFTFILALFTYYLWQEAKRSREYQIGITKPELSIIFEPSKRFINWINIKIKNIGRSALYDLELTNVDNDLICSNGKKLSELNYLKKINYLRPDQEIEQFFISFIDSDKKPEDFVFSLSFKYRDKDGTIYKKTFNFDFSQFLDMQQVGDEPIYKISKSLESLDKNIRHLVSGSKKIQVVTQTKKEMQEEERRLIEKMKKARG